jgi:hypothetical protein
MSNPTASDKEIRRALDMIKRHINESDTIMNRELHTAVQILVTEFRKCGQLQEHGAR